MIDYYEPNIDLTLLGCGFLGTYHIGALCLLSQIWPHKPYNKICGSSCGGLLAALLVSGCSLNQVLETSVHILEVLRSSSLNLFKMRALKDLVEESLERLLPENAHKLCSNRLGLSLTRLWSFENKFVSEFDSRQDLINAVSAGCFIPLWSGSLMAPKFRGESFIDGAYSDNKPRFETITSEGGITGTPKPIQINLSPFAGELEVSPPKTGSTLIKVMGVYHCATWNNAVRSVRAMFPVSLKHYQFYLMEGHRDMKEYLLDHDLIRCRRCYLLPRASSNNAANNSRSSDDPQVSGLNLVKLDDELAAPCLTCLLLLEKIDSLEVPGQLISIIDRR